MSKVQEARIMSSAEVVGAPAGDTGGTAIEVAVAKRGRQTSAERSKRARLKKNAAAGGAASPFAPSRKRCFLKA